jgi:asparagine synthase (glutamine-hydrolysing)
MEGIAGTYGKEDRDLVCRMLRKLKHRGPDDRRMHEDDRVVLGARAARLGQVRQRAIAEDDGVTVASDSYLFNRELLKEAFVPNVDDVPSDPELLLRMYMELGTDMFGYLDGGFSVAIADGRRTILARDRYGLKPLYLSGGIRMGSYSSEMKSQMLAEEEFVPFPPGKMMVSGKGFMPIRQRRTLDGRVGRSTSNVAALREALTKSTEEASGGTDGFNILLSGGIDSSAIAAAASLVTDDLDTVCVGFEGGEDAGMARKVSDRLGTNHKEITYEADEMLDVLDDVVYSAESFDFPLIRSCIPNYMATHSFEDRGKVLLCGEGGDEVFAGYDYMREIRDDSDLRNERRNLLRTGHLTGFQRVDRMTASASLDGRMPIMSRKVVDLGLGMSRRSIMGADINRTKLPLRRAFADLLPKQVTRRRKQRFSDGAGSMTALVDVTDRLISDEEFERERGELPRNRIRTKEELLYFRAFKKRFDSESAVRAVGFTPRP